MTQRSAEVPETETKANSEGDDRDNFCPNWKIVREGYEVNYLTPALAIGMRTHRKRFCRPKEHREDCDNREIMPPF